MTDSGFLDILIQGGLASVALVSLWIIYKLSTNHSKHIEAAADKMTQAMDRNTDAWIKNAEAITKLAERIK